MYKIVHILPAKGRFKRWKVFFQDSSSILLSEAIIHKYLIKKGSEFDEDRFATLLQEEYWQSTLEKSIELLSYRDHSIFELKQKLKQREFPEKIIDEVIEHLKLRSYLDDEKFAQHYVNDLVENKKYGPLVIKSKLFSKGIPEVIITQIMNNMEEDQIISNCRFHYSKKIKKIKNKEKQEIRQKMNAFLTQKGFYWETIKTVLGDAF